MKKLFLMLMVLAVFPLLHAEKIYRSDGSFFEVKRKENVFARKVAPTNLKAPENYNLKWSFKNEFIVIEKDGIGTLPVYQSGLNAIVAETNLFYEGDKEIAYIEEKYGLKLIEIWPDYNLIEFNSKGDSVKIAASIVENGDGFAFPNIIRKMTYHSEAVKFPVEDNYYTKNYQWSLKNEGNAINPEGKEISTLKNADIRFEQTIEFINNAIDAGELDGFEVAKVAIMDSGVDFGHPDLKDKLEDGYNMVHPGETGNPGKIETGGMMGTAGYSHGTNCAGVSAAQGNDIGTAGVCPWCDIFPVTYMEGGSGSGVDQNELLTVYQKYVDDPSIVAINCSFGPMSGFGDVPASEAEIKSHKNFMENGRNKLGGVIVYASGNDGVDAGYHGLMGHPFKIKRNGKDVDAKVVVVGASSAWDTKVPYSNYGSVLDIIAPSLSMNPYLGIATSYLVTYGDLDKDYTNQFSGTSSAAPVVTGVFGVIFSVNPSLTLEEAMKILHDSADKINPETGFWDKNGHSVKFGYGRVNLLKAARLAAGLEMCSDKTDETENNFDDNCDGWVDDGFGKDISKVGKECSSDSDCTNDDFEKDDVQCLKGEFKSYKFSKGYCTIKNSSFACPDGTSEYSDAATEKNCLLECNNDNKCPEGFVCNDDVLGKCFPKCAKDEDCAAGSYCSDDKECRKIPAEPGGECESSEDCKYGASCLTMVPGGICLKECTKDSECGDGGAQCVTINVMGQGEGKICLPACETSADCRNIGGFVQMQCHEIYDGKEDICSMPCTTKDDCYDENAECKNSICYSTKSEVSDEDTTDDEINDEEASFENDPVPDEETSKAKKSSGCSTLMLF